MEEGYYDKNDDIKKLIKDESYPTPKLWVGDFVKLRKNWMDVSIKSIQKHGYTLDGDEIEQLLKEYKSGSKILEGKRLKINVKYIESNNAPYWSQINILNNSGEMENFILLDECFINVNPIQLYKKREFKY